MNKRNQFLARPLADPGKPVEASNKTNNLFLYFLQKMDDILEKKFNVEAIETKTMKNCDRSQKMAKTETAVNNHIRNVS